MTVSTLQELFAEELQDLYDAEHQILKALPKMIAAANSDDLTAAFEEHLSLTEGHVERLEEVFAARGLKPKRKACDGMAGLLAEGEKVLKEPMSDEVRDAALIAAAQRVEHYEMAVYGTLRTYARELADLDSARLLQATLDEEADADRTLTQLAEFSINLLAAAETPVSR
jgi:ferritin-like metal-binding protein YciE